MDAKYPVIDFVSSIWPSIKIWVTTKLLTFNHGIELTEIILAYLLALVFSKKIKHLLEEKIKTSPDDFKLLRSIAKFIFPICWMVFLWVLALANHQLKIEGDVLRTASSLLNAYVLISILSRLISRSFISQIIALVVWITASLNILNLLDPTVKLLEEISFSIGKTELSLFSIIRFLISGAILLTLASGVSNAAETKINKSKSLAPSSRVLLGKAIRFSLLSFAVIFAVSSAGIDLTALAVFGGALGVGIGFGLQKIVSNLICGIILLVDRSIKPGDIIEVEGTFGWVNSLGARCTSILTREGKEYLIPNENIITQPVINWSYSDNYVRHSVKIGVSYSSDIDLVTKLILEAVEENPRILKYPEPNCFLEGFGDSSVNFDLRVWITDPQNGVANITDQILRSVWKKFKENGVEIPFPQRDLHLKSPAIIQIQNKN